MSVINKIEQAMLEMEGGRFQKICNLYLSANGYNINAEGSVTSTNKTKKGTPDCFIKSSHGNFIFVEYTTQQTEVYKKFVDDISKCVNTKKTGIPKSKISKIILFYNSKSEMSPDEQNKLQKMCGDIELEIYGVSTISSNLYNNHKDIVIDELHINTGYGQVLTEDKFIESFNNSDVAMPINNKFFYRKEELKSLVRSIEKNNLTIVTGRAGVGKTKICLEAIKKYKEKKHNIKINVHCIKYHGKSIYDEIRVHIDDKENHIIFVDDINRLSKDEYNYIFDRVKTNNFVKILATVRDYALESLSLDIKEIQSKEILKIDNFGKEEIAKILENLYEIRNPDFIDRIFHISHGNARISIMAGKEVNKTGNFSTLLNVFDIYERYFANILKYDDCIAKSKSSRLLTAICFFRFINFDDQKFVENNVIDTFNVDITSLENELDILEKKELIERYKNTVKISDQTLSSYIFYKNVLESNSDLLKNILNNFLFNKPNNCKDAFYPCIHKFNKEDIEKKIKPIIESLWNNKTTSDYQKELIIDVFHIYTLTNALIYLKHKVNEVKKNETYNLNLDSDNNYNKGIMKIFSTLLQVGDNETIVNTIELLIDYIHKDPNEIKYALGMLEDIFSVDRNSSINKFKLQKNLISIINKLSLKEEYKHIDDIIVRIATSFLKTEHRKNISYSNKLEIQTINQHFSDELIEFREFIWNIIGNTNIFKILHIYNELSYNIKEKKVIEYDKKVISTKLREYKDEITLKEIIVLDKYVKTLKRKKIKNIKTIEKILNRNDLKFFNLFFPEIGNISDDKQIDDYLRDIPPNISKKVIDDYFNMTDIISEIKINYTSTHILNSIISKLIENQKITHIDVLDYFIDKNEMEKLSSLPVYCDIIDKIGIDNVITKIINSKTKDINYCLLSSYAKCKENYNYFDKIIQLIETINENDVFYLDNDILELANTNQNYYNKLMVSLLEKNDTKFIRWLIIGGINRYHDRFVNLIDNYYNEAKKLFFITLKSDQAYFLKNIFNILFKKDKSFIIDYIDYITLNDITEAKDDFSFLWENEDYYEDIEKTIFYYFEVNKRYYIKPIVYNFFKVNNRNAVILQNNLIKNIIYKHFKNTEKMETIIKLINAFPPDRITVFIEYLISKNIDIKLFEKIHIIPNSYSWSGSKVTLLEKHAEYVNRIVPLLKGIKFLEHKKHLQNLLKWNIKDIETAKVEDFIGEHYLI